MFYLLAGIYAATQIVGVLCLFKAPTTTGFDVAEENEGLLRGE